MARKRIGLALGGGVAKGLAHIGVIKALMELNVPVDCVAGTSSGSIVGAFLAAGMGPDEMRAIGRRTRWRDVVRPVVPRNGLLDSSRLEKQLIAIMGDRLIEDLVLPFAAIATDIQAAREVVITSGPVARAVRASCSIPGFFTPVEIDGRLLVDGGVIDNVPVGAARSLGADLVIAVDLTTRPDATSFSPGIFGIMLRAYEILLHEKRLQEVRGADVLVRPRVEHLGPVKIEAADEYIKAGWEATMGQRDLLADLMEKARIRPLLRYLDPRTWGWSQARR